jgi:hypothetical protein
VIALAKVAHQPATSLAVGDKNTAGRALVEVQDWLAEPASLAIVLDDLLLNLRA